jgi:hypothetical protein
MSFSIRRRIHPQTSEPAKTAFRMGRRKLIGLARLCTERLSADRLDGAVNEVSLFHI